MSTELSPQANRHNELRLFKRVPVDWPGQARIALVLVPLVPDEPPNAVSSQRKDCGYARDSGARRVMRVLDEFSLPASVIAGAGLATHAPRLLAEFAQRQWEIVAAGVSGADVAPILSALRQQSGTAIQGWYWQTGSATRSARPDWAALGANGLRYILAEDSDDLPFPVQGSGGTLYAMPAPLLLNQPAWSNDEIAGQLIAHFSLLWREAEYYGGRLVALAVPCGFFGQAHRIAALHQALEAITRYSGVWPTTYGQALSRYAAQFS